MHVWRIKPDALFSLCSLTASNSSLTKCWWGPCRFVHHILLHKSCVPSFSHALPIAFPQVGGYKIVFQADAPDARQVRVPKPRALLRVGNNTISLTQVRSPRQPPFVDRQGTCPMSSFRPILTAHTTVCSMRLPAPLFPLSPSPRTTDSSP